MFRVFYMIRPVAWGLLSGVAMIVAVPLIAERAGWVSASMATYILQPTLSVILAIATRIVLGGQRDRMRHKAERALIIGSVFSVWFVVYFLSGLIVTYAHNAVAATWIAIVSNIAAFGIAAVAIEYTRHGLMVIAGRRNILWFGLLVAAIFACEQIGLSQLFSLHTTIDWVKFLVETTIPSVASSLLLTYLAFNAGLGPQLTYRLGLVAILYLPPIIPKYDWYLTGIAWLLLAVAVYIAIDRTRKDLAVNGRHYKHARRAYDVMFIIVTVVLAMFMVGAFSYQPKVIMSNSMKPVFSRGSMVIVQKIDPMDVKVGDIVQYSAPGHTTTHRVTKIDFAEDGSGERVYTTQGDNSPSPDPLVKPKQIKGVIRAQIPYIGYPTVWLTEFMK